MLDPSSKSACMFPDRDRYLLKLEGCTFYIERDGPSSWLLSYNVFHGWDSGHYHYRRCSTARDCAALLSGSHDKDDDWIKLKDRISSLVLAAAASDLASWFGGSHLTPR